MATANGGWPVVTALGRKTVALVDLLGDLTIFMLQGFGHVFTMPLRLRRVIEQMHHIGIRSLPIIILTGAFTGMVLGLQGYYTLRRFGAEGMLGSAVALTLVRELGPVLTAFMITGGAGSAMTAELGMMRISEQIDALDTMDIAPVKYLVSPRLAAAVLVFPLLTAIFIVVGLIGGYLTGAVLLGSNGAIYWATVESGMELLDVRTGFIKAFVFSVLVAGICCHWGFHVNRREGGFGARGVSSATTSAVVTSNVVVLIADYLVTSFLMET